MHVGSPFGTPSGDSRALDGSSVCACLEAKRPCSGQATLSLPQHFSGRPFPFFIIINAMSRSSYVTGPKYVKVIRTHLNHFLNVYQAARNHTKVLILQAEHQGIRIEFLDHIVAESGLEYWSYLYFSPSRQDSWSSAAHSQTIRISQQIIRIDVLGTPCTWF